MTLELRRLKVDPHDFVDTTADPVNPDKAIESFRAKLALTPDEFDRIVDGNHARAFTLAGVSDIDVIQDVYSALDRAIAGGTTFEDFKSSVGEMLENAWGGTVANPGWRLETIFRTNVQSAYMAGRYQEAHRATADRPYVTITFVDDDDQSDICADLSDKFEDVAIPLGHPILATIWPPNHHNCRDGVETLTEEQAREMTILDGEDVPEVEVGVGFDGPPDTYRPDPEEYSPELVPEVQRIVEALKQPEPEPPPAPEVPEEHTTDFWEPHYSHYGESARTVAAGRALHERAEAADLDDTIKTLTEVDPKFQLDASLWALQWQQRNPGGKLSKWTARQAANGRVMAQAAREATAKAPEQRSIDSGCGVAARGSIRWFETFGSGSAQQLPSVSWERIPGGRAWYNSRTTTVGLPEKSEPSLAVHEYGHAIEHSNPAVAAAVKAFREHRERNSPVQPLSELQPNAGYRPDEVSRPDEYVDPYIGKVYNAEGLSEVLSMAWEMMAEGRGWELLARDPDHYYFALGILMGQF